MEAKEFLRQVRKIDLLVDSKQKEIINIKSKIYYPKTSLNPDNNILTEDLIIKLVDYEKELNSMIDELIDTKKEVQSVIDKLDNADMIDILYKRYFQYETWEQIAAEKYFTFQWVHKIHAKALIKIKKILNS